MRTLYVRCPRSPGDCGRFHELHVIAGTFEGKPVRRNALLVRLIAVWIHGALDLGELREGPGVVS